MLYEKTTITMPPIVSSAAAVFASFTILLNGKVSSSSFDDANNWVLLLASILLALSGAAFTFQAILAQAAEDENIKEHLGARRIDTSRRLVRIYHYISPWLVGPIGILLSYRAMPLAGPVFGLVAVVVVVAFGVMSGRLLSKSESKSE